MQTAKRAKWISGLTLLSMLLYLSGFFVWLTPLPVLYGYKRGGRLLGLLTLGCALLALFALYQGIALFAAKQGVAEAAKLFFWLPGMGMGEIRGWSPLSYGIFYYACYGAMGALLGEWEPTERSPTRLVGRTVGVLAAGIVIWIYAQTQGGFAGSISALEGYFSDLLNQMTMISEDNSEVQQQLAILQTYRDSIVYYAVRLMPAVIINSLIFITWLNILVSRRLFFKDGMFPRLVSLKEWNLPFAGVWLLIFAAVVLLLDAYWLHVGYLKILALNVFLVFGLAYFFQGLSIAAYYGKKWTLSPWVKLAFYVLLILFIQPIAFALIAFGFFDSWFDFRKLSPKTARP
jgi:uncharacterized protein YybS (DUF2232 family)